MVAIKHLFGPAVVVVVARRHLLGSMRRTWREAQLASAQMPAGLLFVAEVAAGCEVVGAVGAGGGRWLGSGVLSPACFLHHTHAHRSNGVTCVTRDGNDDGKDNRIWQ